MSMMKSFAGKIFLLTAGAATGVFLNGCGPDHPAPPTERNELVVRFFTSMKNGDSSAAAEQGAKLLAIDPGNDYIARLIMVQQSNSFIQQAQRKLNSGDVNGALAVIEQGLARYPLNRTLVQVRGSLRRLRNAPRLLQAMRDAKSSSAMNAALTAANIGLAGEKSPRLEAYFNRYREEIAAAAARERAGVVVEPAAPVSIPAGK